MGTWRPRSTRPLGTAVAAVGAAASPHRGVVVAAAARRRLCCCCCPTLWYLNVRPRTVTTKRAAQWPLGRSITAAMATTRRRTRMTAAVAEHLQLGRSGPRGRLPHSPWWQTMRETERPRLRPVPRRLSLAERHRCCLGHRRRTTRCRCLLRRCCCCYRYCYCCCHHQNHDARRASGGVGGGGGGDGWWRSPRHGDGGVVVGARRRRQGAAAASSAARRARPQPFLARAAAHQRRHSSTTPTTTPSRTTCDSRSRHARMAMVGWPTSSTAHTEVRA